MNFADPKYNRYDLASAFAERRRASTEDLVGEIATRERSFDYMGMIGLLPDPDPVLRKRGDGVEVLDDLTGDGHLTAVIQSRKSGTLSQEYRWLPGVEDDEKPSAAAVALRDQFVRDIKHLDMHNLIAQILDAPLYGHTPMELIWRPEGARIRLAEIRTLPVRWFAWESTDNQPRFLAADSPWDGEKLPWGKFIFARHFPTYENPYGLRLLSRCFWPITFKRGGLKFWIQFVEKYGMPFLVGTAPMGTTREKQQEILASLVKMVADAVAVVNDPTKVELIEGATGQSMTHERLKMAMDAEVSKVILGETLTTEAGERGARSLGEVHADVKWDYQETDRKLVSSTMNRIGSIYGEINAPGVPPPVWDWFEEQDVQKDRAIRDRMLAATGQVGFNKVYFVREYGFQEDDIDVLPPAPRDGGFFPSFAERTPAQQDVDDFVQEQIRVGAMVTDEQATAILQAVQAAQDFDDLEDRLMDILQDLDADGFAAAMQQALIAADMYGRSTLSERGR